MRQETQRGNAYSDLAASRCSLQHPDVLPSSANYLPNLVWVDDEPSDSFWVLGGRRVTPASPAECAAFQIGLFQSLLHDCQSDSPPLDQPITHCQFHLVLLTSVSPVLFHCSQALHMHATSLLQVTGHRSKSSALRMTCHNDLKPTCAKCEHVQKILCFQQTASTA